MPNDTDVRVYLDLDRDGRWDKVIFAIDALLINENDAAGWGRWLVLHSNALSNLEIASAGLSPYGLYEEFDIADTVWRLAVSTDDPDIGLGLDVDDPGLTFDVAVRVQDQMSDYPDGPGGAPLRDDAPSGFAASGGPRYTFSRQANNCLAIRQPDGRTGQPGRGSSFTVPADLAPGAQVLVTALLALKVQPLQDLAHVIADGHFAEMQRRANLGIRQALGDQGQDVWGGLHRLGGDFQLLFGIQHGSFEGNRPGNGVEFVNSQLRGCHDFDIPEVEDSPEHALLHLDIIDLFQRGIGYVLVDDAINLDDAPEGCHRGIRGARAGAASCWCSPPWLSSPV